MIKKVKIITQERGTSEEFEKKVEEFINNVGQTMKEIHYSVLYDDGYDDYVYSVMIIYE